MPSEIIENPLQKPINPHIHAINDSYTDPTPWARMKSVMKSYPVKHSLAVVSAIAHLTENWSGLVSVNFDFNLNCSHIIFEQHRYSTLSSVRWDLGGMSEV